MTGELFARVLINNDERKEIQKAISVMEEVRDAYEKTGLESTTFLVDDLNNGISVLKGVLEELYY